MADNNDRRHDERHHDRVHNKADADTSQIVTGLIALLVIGGLLYYLYTHYMGRTAQEATTGTATTAQQAAEGERRDTSSGYATESAAEKTEAAGAATGTPATR